MEAAPHPPLEFLITIREDGGGRECRNCELEVGPLSRVTQIINGLNERVEIPDTQFTFTRVTATHASNTADRPEDVFAVCGEEQQFANEEGVLFSRKEVFDIQHVIIKPEYEDSIFRAPRGRRSKVVAWKQNSMEEIDISNSMIMEDLGGYDSGACLCQELGGNHIKFVKKELRYENVRDKKLADTEILILTFLHHRNIVHYYTSVIIQNQPTIYMEYVNGKSLSVVMQNGIMEYSTISNYASQMVDALAYLYDEGLIHRDIRPSNVLISNNGILKLKGFRSLRFTKCKPNCLQTVNSDFLTKYKDSSRSQISFARRNVYKSPEVVKDKVYTTEADIWSLGLIVLQMVTGEEPWRGKTDSDIHNAMKDEELPHRIYAGNISVQWNDFFDLVFNYNDVERPTARDLQGQPFYIRL